mmetsp:Transcript_15371/g.37216  ORF Transcript_15371/g.37216 Transcript_15371/m.37216 type:complete len:623 (+) Transcript_15371:2611-4479(+)
MLHGVAIHIRGLPRRPLGFVVRRARGVLIARLPVGGKHGGVDGRALGGGGAGRQGKRHQPILLLFLLRPTVQEVEHVGVDSFALLGPLRVVVLAAAVKHPLPLGHLHRLGRLGCVQPCFAPRLERGGGAVVVVKGGELVGAQPLLHTLLGPVLGARHVVHLQLPGLMRLHHWRAEVALVEAQLTQNSLLGVVRPFGVPHSEALAAGRLAHHERQRLHSLPHLVQSHLVQLLRVQHPARPAPAGVASRAGHLACTAAATQGVRPRRLSPGAGVVVRLLEHRLAPAAAAAAAAQRDGHGQQRVHLLLLLEQQVQAVRAAVRHLEAVDEHQAGVEVADGVRVAALHQVREPHVVRRGHRRARHLGEHPRLVQVHRVQHRERRGVVAQQHVHAVQPDQAEVPQGAQHVAAVVVVPLLVGPALGAGALALQHAHDVALVHQRLQVVEHPHHVPHRVAVLQQRQLLLGLHRQLPAVLAEALELIDELVHHLPQPQVGQLHVDVAVQDDTEQVAVVVPRLAALLQGRRHLGVHVAEVHLLVEQAEDVVAVGEARDRLDRRPGRRLEVPLADGAEGLLVHGQDLVHVLLADVAVEVHHELLHHVGHRLIGLGQGEGVHAGTNKGVSYASA